MDYEATTSFSKVLCKAAKKSALLCEINGKDFWVPQEIIHDDSEVYKRGHEGKLVVYRFWAKDKGLI